MIKKEEIEQIRKSIDPIKYLSDRGIEVIKQGTSYVALCPIHSERSPSFHVRPEWNRFHCFGCGFSGDIFSLVGEMDSLSFGGAIVELAEYAGIEIKNEEEDKEYKKLRRLYDLTEAASGWFRSNFQTLPVEHPAKLNLSERLLLDAADENPNIGFSPNQGLTQHLKNKGFYDNEIKEVGLLNEKGNQLFRNRIVWSIRNIQGKVVGFTARRVYETDTGPKYINSPATVLYNKSLTLFGLYEAHKSIVKTQKVYVVEGQTDVDAMRAAGITNVVATCGTAFGKEHSNILQRLADRGKDTKHFTVVFCFDGDKAGVKAARKVYDTDPSLQLISEVITMPEGSDPCDFRTRNGDEALIEEVQKTVTLTEFILKQVLNEWDIRSIEGQTKFLKEATEILANIKDTSMLDSYARKISWWLGVPVGEIEQLINKNSTRKNVTATQTQTNTGISLSELRKRVLAALLQHPQETRKALNDYEINAEMFQNEGKKIYEEALNSMGDKTILNMTDFSNEALATELLFVDIHDTASENVAMTVTAEERVLNVTRNIVKVFATSYRLAENMNIQSRIAKSFGGEHWVDDESLLEEVLLARENLNVKKRRLGKKK